MSTESKKPRRLRKAKAAKKAGGEGENKEGIEPQFKQCPRCRVFTERLKGCNLMRCTVCPKPRTKWCWVCEKVKQRKDKPEKKEYCSDESHGSH